MLFFFFSLKLNAFAIKKKYISEENALYLMRNAMSQSLLYINLFSRKMIHHSFDFSTTRRMDWYIWSKYIVCLYFR